MAMKRCPVCGERYSDTYKECPFCEEDEFEEEEQQEIVRRPILREGVRSPGRRGKSAYGIITPILIVLIVLMAALLVYLLYGDKIADKFAKKTPDDTDKPGITTPVKPGNTPAIDSAGTAPEDANPSGTTPEDGEPSGTPDGGSMPEGNGGETPSGENAGGMSYAAAAALPSGLTLNSRDFTRSVSAGPYQLKVSGGTGTYTWISENPAIATVASDGTVTPVANGTTNILVTDGSKKAICIVRVNGGSAPASGGGTTAAPSTPTPSTPAPSTTNTNTPSGGGSLKTGSAVVINGGNGVRVRSGPGTNYDILATIPNGGSVQITSDAGNGWYAITFSASGGVTTAGYMKGDYLANA